MRSMAQSTSWAMISQDDFSGQTATLIMDYAMNYDPTKYREPTTDYFGKKGIGNAHINNCDL